MTSELCDRAVEWPCTRVSTTPGILMNFVVDEVVTPDGGHMVRNYLAHPDAVGIIVMNGQQHILVERQYRHPVRRKLVEAPAGLCDHTGESLLLTARRELAEEAGLAAGDWRILCDIFATPGCSTQATRIFLAQDVSPVPRPAGFILEAEEADMVIEWAPIDQLVRAIYSGRIMNPTLVTGIMALKAALLGGGMHELRIAE